MFKSKAKRLFGVGKQNQHQHEQQISDTQQELELQVMAKQEYFDFKTCHRTYSCTHCRAHLADHDQLISKLFQGNHGRAYLFNKVVNIGCKQAVQRELLTGLHAVADIYCDNCETTLGWKYEQAFVPSQKYKEGKYIIELVHMLKENNWDLTSYNACELIKQESRTIGSKLAPNDSINQLLARNINCLHEHQHNYRHNWNNSPYTSAAVRNVDDDDNNRAARKSPTDSLPPAPPLQLAERRIPIDDRPIDSVIISNQVVEIMLEHGETLIGRLRDEQQHNEISNNPAQSNDSDSDNDDDDGTTTFTTDSSTKQSPPLEAEAKAKDDLNQSQDKTIATYNNDNNNISKSSETTTAIDINVVGIQENESVDAIERSLVELMAVGETNSGSLLSCATEKQACNSSSSKDSLCSSSDLSSSSAATMMVLVIDSDEIISKSSSPIHIASPQSPPSSSDSCSEAN